MCARYIPPLGKNRFIELTDTPASYSGQAGKYSRVKSDEAGLEFDEVAKEFSHQQVPSETLRISNDPEKSTNSSYPTKLKEIKMLTGWGGLRIRYDYKAGTEGFVAYFRVYKNGGAIGTLVSSTLAAWATKTEDLGPFYGGDLIQLYVWCDEIHYGFIRNFRIYCDPSGGQKFKKVGNIPLDNSNWLLTTLPSTQPATFENTLV